MIARANKIDGSRPRPSPRRTEHLPRIPVVGILCVHIYYIRHILGFIRLIYEASTRIRGRLIYMYEAYMRLIRDRCGDWIQKSSGPGPLAFENKNPYRLGGRGSQQYGAPLPPERHLQRTACQRQTGRKNLLLR